MLAKDYDLCYIQGRKTAYRVFGNRQIVRILEYFCRAFKQRRTGAIKDGERRIWDTQDKIAENLLISRRTLQYYCQILEDIGILKRAQGMHSNKIRNRMYFYSLDLDLLAQLFQSGITNFVSLYFEIVQFSSDRWCNFLANTSLYIFTKIQYSDLSKSGDDLEKIEEDKDNSQDKEEAQKELEEEKIEDKLKEITDEDLRKLNNNLSEFDTHVQIVEEVEKEVPEQKNKPLKALKDLPCLKRRITDENKIEDILSPAVGTINSEGNQVVTKWISDQPITPSKLSDYEEWFFDRCEFIGITFTDEVKQAIGTHQYGQVINCTNRMFGYKGDPSKAKIKDPNSYFIKCLSKEPPCVIDRHQYTKAKEVVEQFTKIEKERQNPSYFDAWQDVLKKLPSAFRRRQAIARKQQERSMANGSIRSITTRTRRR